MRIAITGPESTGKTALAIQIAEAIGVPYCPEAARTYLQHNPGNYTFTDLENIASLQVEWWRKTSAFSRSWIADSDYWVMHVWQEEKFKKVSDSIKKSMDEFTFDLVLLCAPDIPWKYDVLRENQADRDRLFALYHATMRAHGIDFNIVHGLGDERLKCAMAIINEKRR